MGNGSAEEFVAHIGEMRYEKFVSVELDGTHLPGRPHPQVLAPEAVDRAADKGADASITSGKLASMLLISTVPW